MISSKGKWIWFPGDYEIELSAKFMRGRYERDIFIPTFWKQYSAWRNVKFSKRVVLKHEETVFIECEGVFNILIDGKYLYETTDSFTVESGLHDIVVSVYNDNGVPTVKICGENLYTDNTWLVTANDHRYVNAADSDALIDMGGSPNSVKLPTKELSTIKVIGKGESIIYDFGKEIFAFVKLSGISFAEDFTIYYGESEEEVLNGEECELIYSCVIEKGCKEYVTKIAKAFRYVRVSGAKFNKISALFEYLPLKNTPKFICSDKLLNNIYNVSLYTLSLNMREFIIDGIKRDRWLWGGDAYQGYLFNYYSYFDKDIVKRTTLALFGKRPFDTYINHIVDYTFFWLIGFYDYYFFTKDSYFIKENILNACSLADYCISRTNENGLVEGHKGDWIFVDWAENIAKDGELCFEQILYFTALDRFVCLLKILGENDLSEKYRKIAESVKVQIEKFWDEDKSAYVHSFKNGKSDGVVLKYANIFAILYGICDEKRQKLIVDNVLKNPKIQKITTPYMRFFELSALMQAGEYKMALDDIRSYWGGMLNEGATSFWEYYDKNEVGPKKYAMYGRKFGKSLCHTWGSGPLYLIGKYMVGISPAEDGNGVIVKPNLGDLHYFKAEIPMSKGVISVEMDEKQVKVKADVEIRLIFEGKTYNSKKCNTLKVKRGIYDER